MDGTKVRVFTSKVIQRDPRSLHFELFSVVSDCSYGVNFHSLIELVEYSGLARLLKSDHYYFLALIVSV